MNNDTRNHPDRERALALLKRHTESESLVRHALTVEAVMLHFSSLYEGEDPLKWRIIGLLHDIDYEKWPDRHCHVARELLAPEGWPEEIIRAVESHGWKICIDVEPKTNAEKVLYATDELTGLVAASALMRPSRSVMDLEVSSVKKKWKTKGFAAGVNREIVLEGAAMLGMELDVMIGHVIEGMRTAAAEIGLPGSMEAADGAVVGQPVPSTTPSLSVESL